VNDGKLENICSLDFCIEFRVVNIVNDCNCEGSVITYFLFILLVNKYNMVNSMIVVNIVARMLLTIFHTKNNL
jgi:hypothetical protein